MSTTSSVKQLLPLEEKRKLMLKDLEVELQKYKEVKGMEWWVMRLEDKLKEFNEYNKAS
jgi:hypothetical protein